MELFPPLTSTIPCLLSKDDKEWVGSWVNTENCVQPQLHHMWGVIKVGKHQQLVWWRVDEGFGNVKWYNLEL
jgi:hypothetical protein